MFQDSREIGEVLGGAWLTPATRIGLRGGEYSRRVFDPKGHNGASKAAAKIDRTAS